MGWKCWLVGTEMMQTNLRSELGEGEWGGFCHLGLMGGRDRPQAESCTKLAASLSGKRAPS